MVLVFRQFLNRPAELRLVRLRTILIVPFVLQVVGVVGLVGYLSYRSGQQAVEDLAQQLMEETGDHVVYELDHYLEMAHATNSRHIAALESGAISAQDLEQLHRYLILQHQQTDGLTTSLFGAPDGEFRMVRRVGENEFESESTHGNVLDLPLEAGVSDLANPSQLNIFSIDDKGNLIQQIETTENVDVRDRPWYRYAVETGKPGWSEPFQLGASNLLGLSAYHPIYTEDQQLVGVFSVNISLNRLNQILKTLPVGETGEIFIMERSGLMIANSAQEQPYITSVQAYASDITTPGVAKFRRLAAHESSNPLIRSAAQHFQALKTAPDPREINLDLEVFQASYLAQFVPGLVAIDWAVLGIDTPSHDLMQRHFLHFTPYQDDYGLDWLIVTVVPESDFTAQIQANLRRTIGLCVLALLGAIAIGIWVARRIIRPILALDQEVKAIAIGHWQPSTHPTGILEVESLRRAFGLLGLNLQAADQLRRNYAQELEQQVAAKTAALQASEAKLKAAQRIAQVGSWEMEVATGQIIGSEVLFEIAGRQPDDCQLSYPDCLNSVPPEDRGALQQAMERAIADGIPYEVEHRLMRPDGAVCSVISRAEAILNSQGRVVKLAGTVIDITARKRAEQALLQSEERWTLAIEGSKDGIWDHDLITNHHYLSPRCTEILGYDFEEIDTFDKWFNLIHPDDQPVLKTAFQRYLARQTPAYESEYRMRCKDGSYKWLLARGKALWDITGIPVRAVGSISDITARKQAELALQQSEARLKLITDSVPGCISYIDADQRYQFVNQTYEQWFNCCKDNIIGRTVREVIGSDAYGHTQSYIEQVLAGETVTYEAELPYHWGATRFVSGVLVPDIGPQGLVRGYYALITDISDRKQVETLIRQSEARYRDILEDQTELIARFHLDGTLIFVNDAYCRHFGLSREQIIGQSYKPVVYPEDQFIIDQCLASLGPEHPVSSIEHRVIVKGEIRWMQWVNRAIYDSQGNLVELQSVGRDIHDRKQAELALEQTTRQLQAFLDNAPAMISLFDAEGRYLRVNPAFAKFFNCPAHEIVGRTFADLVPDETIRLFKTRLLRLAETRQPLEVEDEVEIEGTRQTFQSILFPVMDKEDESGKGIDTFCAIATDITERKRIEKALTAKTEELDRFFSVALDLLCIADTDGYFHRVNHQWAKTLGHSIQDLEGSRFLNYVHPEDIDATLAVLKALADQREVHNFVNRYRCRDGSYRWIEWRSVPIGKLVYAAARDITDRKQAEFFLQESEEKFATVFHFNPTPGWIATLEDGRIVEVNDGFSEFYGESVATLIGKTYVDLGLWDDPRDLQAFQQILQATKRSPNFEVILRTRSGEPRTVLISASVSWINDQECVIGVLNDISDRKQAELQVQQALAEKEILLQEVYHRVKNNLQLIQSMLHMQQQRIDEPHAAQILEESWDRVKAISLVHEILYQSDNLAEIDLADYVPALLQQVATSYRSTVPLVTIQTQVQPVIISMKKAIYCGLILNELVTNALKYAFHHGKEGCVDVQVTVDHPEPEASTICITVVDNGMGLPTDLSLTHLSTLGLNLVQDFVNQLWGTLEIQSNVEPHCGTQFSITFQVRTETT